MSKPETNQKKSNLDPLTRRVEQLEEAVSKSKRFTLIVSLVAAFLGSGGAVGVIKFWFEHPLTKIQIESEQIKLLEQNITALSQTHERKIESVEAMIKHSQEAGEPLSIIAFKKQQFQYDKTFHDSLVLVEGQIIRLQGAPSSLTPTDTFPPNSGFLQSLATK